MSSGGDQITCYFSWRTKHSRGKNWNRCWSVVFSLAVFIYPRVWDCCLLVELTTLKSLLYISKFFINLFLCVRFKPATVIITSELPLGSGLDSSAALCVAFSGALLALSDCASLDFSHQGWLDFGESELDLLNKWAFEGEKIIHGRPSGIDNTVSTYGKLLYHMSQTNLTLHCHNSSCTSNLCLGFLSCIVLGMNQVIVCHSMLRWERVSGQENLRHAVQARLCLTY